MTAFDDDLYLTPVALAEIDYVVERRGGRTAAMAVLEDVAAGVYGVRWWADATTAAVAIARDHPELGIADASLVALADLLRTDRVFTFDRHFDGLVTPGGRTLSCLPRKDPA